MEKLGKPGVWLKVEPNFGIPVHFRQAEQLLLNKFPCIEPNNANERANWGFTVHGHQQ